MRTLKWLLLILVGLLVLGAAGFVIWGSTPLGPMPEALAALQSDDQVQVEVGRWLVFSPVGVQADTGFIFYPGGRVDYRSYAPAARAIAEQGFRVVIVRMPLSLAVLGVNRAEEVLAAYPEMRRWVIGGHSLGGAMAANFVYTHPGTLQGLALWAAYPASNNDLSQSGLAVVSIYASEDGLATGEKIEASRSLLPPETRWVEIEGGNHAQFGWYGVQPGDGIARIDRQAQQDQVVAALVLLLAGR